MRAPAVPGQHGSEAPSARDDLTAGTRGSGTTREPPSLRALLLLCAHYMPPADLDLIRAAYTVAEAAHHGALRKSGEPFIEHPLAVARTLAELAIDASGIAAALLHDTVEDTSLRLEDVCDRFGPVIANIVDGVTKFTAVEAVEPQPQMGGVEALEKARQRSETVRKLFLAMSQDPRVVLLKLADRLHNMRTLGSMTDAQRERTARETLEIYAPLAGRIGLYLIKTELEDLAFSYTQPDTFASTVARLQREVAGRARWTRAVAERLRRELAAQGVCAVVNWRVKHPYRAFRESEESGIDLGGLHDLIAFRVLVNTPRDCYQALRVIHHLWHPHADRIRDYIGTPKVNGYQSFHTAVFALENELVQIHIRTHAMHRAAQHGVATYWLERAARGERVDDVTPVRVEEVLGWVTQLATWQRELELSAADFVATVRGDLLEDQMYVFTPKGDIRELPEGSTVLDLAYQIHTAVGDHAIGAHIQTNTSQGILVTRDVPVAYVLRRGDVVRVLTSPDAKPDIAWLDIVRTRYAREKIGRALRLLQRAADADDRTRHLDESPTALEPLVTAPLTHPSGRPAAVELARCCYPCPGDQLAGLVRGARRVTVHRTCCRTLHHTLSRRTARGARYTAALPVVWPQLQPASYRAQLEISGQDHTGLMHELSQCAAGLGLNVAGSNASANQSRHKAAITLTLELPPDARLENVLRRLHTVPGVLRVERDILKGCEKDSASTR
jgi:GTP diphosphokinase / guanosine-3',5'-bis(diphosphate) 3'-diphosphatase